MVNDHKIQSTKGMNKATDYFKTFYSKPTSKNVKG